MTQISSSPSVVKPATSVQTIMVILSLTSLLMVITAGTSDADGSDVPDTGHRSTRGGPPPDFDVQFILEPSDDVLDPLFGKKHAELSPRMQATYWAMITNFGQENDTFHLELFGPSWDTGWQFYFLDQESREVDVQLTSCELRDLYGGRSIATFPVRLIVPTSPSKDSRIPITVKAVSLTDLSELGAEAPVDSDDMFIIVGETQDLFLPDPSQRIFHVGPGEWLTIPFQLSNNGNKDIVNMTVVLEEDAFWRSSYRDFEYTYTRNTYLLEFEWTSVHLSIKQGTRVSKDIRVRVPTELFGSGEVFQFRASAHIDGHSRYGISKVYTIITKGNIDINAYLPKEGPIDIIPGGKNITEVHIVSHFWENDLIDDVHLLEPKGVTIEVFNSTMGKFNELEVPRNEKVTIFVAFHIGNDAPPGPLELTLVFQPRYYETIFLKITLNVSVNDSIELLPTDTLLPGSIPFLPGEGRSLVLGVRNGGNTFRNVSLELKGAERNGSLLGIGWSSRVEWVSQVREPPYFRELGPDEVPMLTYGSDPDLGYLVPKSLDGKVVVFGVAPGETVWASLRVDCPDRGGISIVPSLLARAVLLSDEDEVLAEMVKELTVDYPDLDVTSFSVVDEQGNLIDSAKEDQKVYVMFNVTNKGTGYSDWVDAEVRADNEKVLDVPIRPLAPGEWVKLIREISAVGGTREVRFELDPENEVIESNDQFMEGSTKDANIIRTSLSVEEEDSGPSDILPYMLLAVLIAGLLLMLIVLSARSIRSRTREHEQ